MNTMNYTVNHVAIFGDIKYIGFNRYPANVDKIR